MSNIVWFMKEKGSSGKNKQDQEKIIRGQVEITGEDYEHLLPWIVPLRNCPKKDASCPEEDIYGGQVNSIVGGILSTQLDDEIGNATA